jgi:hypothetical protein
VQRITLRGFYYYIDKIVNRGSPELANTTTGLTLAYRSLLVEERIETFVYDLENLMTSIGGNLVTLSR